MNPTIVPSALRRIEAAIFPADRYTWVPAKKAHTFLKNGKPYRIAKGAIIGVRPASSKKGVYRVVSKELGQNIVFSCTEAELGALVGKPGSSTAPVTKVKPPVSSPVAKLPLKTQVKPKIVGSSLKLEVTLVNPKGFVDYILGKYKGRQNWEQNDVMNDVQNRIYDLIDPITKWYRSNSLYIGDTSAFVRAAKAFAPFFKVKCDKGVIYRGLALPSKHRDKIKSLTSKKPSSWAMAHKVAYKFGEATEAGQTSFVLATQGVKAGDIMLSSMHTQAVNKAAAAITPLLTRACIDGGMKASAAKNEAQMLFRLVVKLFGEAEDGEVILAPGAYPVTIVSQDDYED